MGREASDARVEELLRLLQQQERLDSSVCLETADELLAVGQKRGDARLCGTAYFYRAMVYYSRSDLNRCGDETTRALGYLRESEEWEMAGRCYNMMGLLLDFRGDYAGALDSFYMGIELTTSHGAWFGAAILSQNLSTSFEETGDYTGALEYRLEARTCLERQPGHARYGEMRLLIESMLLRLYLLMGRRDDAVQQMTLMHALMEQYPEERDELNILIYETIYEYRCGDAQRAALLLEKSEQKFADCGRVLDFFDDYLALARCLAESGHVARALRVLDRAAAGLGSENNTDDLQLRIESCRVECCLQGSEPEALNAALLNHFELSRRVNVEFSRTRRRMMNLRRALDQTRGENRTLSHKAMTDELTGLPNRRYLGEVKDEWFDSAYQNHTMFAIGMVDIDTFKALNDAYGHDGGDRCLQFLAEKMASQADECEFVARYGGDEFLILYRGLDEAEILARAGRLRDVVAAESAGVGCGSFTVSQGICIGVPAGSNRVWDYSACADGALYYVKQNGRCGVKAVHSSAELRGLAVQP